jgi:two-component system chemotaxis response regulator CheY
MAKTLVMIDDSSFVISQLEPFFIKLGFTILATGKDGNEAIFLYNKFKPDLMTIDLIMPNKSGGDALAEIIQQYPNANILLITAVRATEVTECLNLGARDYIEKPLRMHDQYFLQEFEKTVREIVPDI